MVVNELIFEDAEKARDSITKAQKIKIEKLYKKWANEVGDKANFYKGKKTSSSFESEIQMKELKKFLKKSSERISKEIEKEIKDNIYLVSNAVVNSNKKWLKSLGFETKALDIAFGNVPDKIVRNLITGKIYKSGWSLSKRIWSDSRKTMQVAYEIVAGGFAQNKSVYEISKDLEKYVQPGAKKMWNLKDKDGKMIYPRRVDYNAQRLARTLAQHGYQQSFQSVTKNNPLVKEYEWDANGSRACPICLARSGQRYSKDSLPMDHPNGMCTMIPVLVDDVAETLSNWYNSDKGTYSDLDKFASNFGYKE